MAAGLRDPSPRVSRKAAQLLAALLTERPALGPPVADAAAAALPPLLGAGDRDVREAALGLAAALAEDARAAPTLFQVPCGRLPAHYSLLQDCCIRFPPVPRVCAMQCNENRHLPAASQPA